MLTINVIQIVLLERIVNSAFLLIGVPAIVFGLMILALLLWVLPHRTTLLETWQDASSKHIVLLTEHISSQHHRVQAQCMDWELPLNPTAHHPLRICVHEFSVCPGFQDQGVEHKFASELQPHGTLVCDPSAGPFSSGCFRGLCGLWSSCRQLLGEHLLRREHRACLEFQRIGVCGGLVAGSRTRNPLQRQL